ncbi:hypothetical protein GQ457_13G002430 [Hibiscus cannabinus]
MKVLLSCEPLPFFANLAALEIHYCPDHYRWPISTNKGLEILLTSLPELEKLSFYQESVSSLPENVPPCLSFKLKVMEVSNFMDDENCMEMAKYILKNGGALEKLTIFTSPSSSEAERMKISQVLLGSPRKAKQCCVLVVCQPSCECEIDDEMFRFWYDRFSMTIQVKMEDVDRLSDLPDSVLSHILSFLSTKEAVGTSILSSKWRYLFTLVPNLDFDLEAEKTKSYTVGVDSCISFVEKMLFFHNMANIEKFRLKSKTEVDSNCVCRWISAVAGRGVKHLGLKIRVDTSTTFPCVLFTCRTLVTLKLHKHSFVLDVPNSIHLPNLKTLHLSRVNFLNDDSFKNLLSGCISLEDMVLRYCYLNLSISHHLLKRLTIWSYRYSCKVMIDTPNLVYFKCSGLGPGRFSLKNMQSLIEADIDIYGYSDDEADGVLVFSGISTNVHSLLLSVRSLKIHHCPDHYYYWSITMNKGLGILLTSLPELEKLSFYQEFVYSLPEKVPPCLSFKLKAVEVWGFTDDENCMEMAKYILKNGGALEKLTIFTSPSSSEAERMKISQVLLGSPRKAKQCSVLVVKMEDVDRLSDLPDSILSHIMSFLSTKEAVGTSVFSSKWRHLFTSFPNLDFDLEAEKTKSYTVVEKMLFFHNMTNIEKFRLKSKTEVDSNCVCRWISAVAGRGVKHLDLNIRVDISTTLPCVVFTCRTLVTLKLHKHYFVLDAPKSVHLPNLKILHLSRVEFSNDDSFKNLLCGCISLEDMVLQNCYLNLSISHHLLKRLTIWSSAISRFTIMIDTPNLVYFKCSDPEAERFSLENMQSLVEADINIYQYCGIKAEGVPVFSGISNVHSLRLSVRSLKIHNCPDHFDWSISTNKGLEILLTSLPELEKLSFDQEFFYSLPEKVPPCLSFKLKAMEVSGFTDDENCMEKAKYILKNGGALEKLTIFTSPSSSEAVRMKISQVLLGSPRKAKQCSVLVVCQPSCECEIEEIDEDMLAFWKDLRY